MQFLIGKILCSNIIKFYNLFLNNTLDTIQIYTIQKYMPVVYDWNPIIQQISIFFDSIQVETKYVYTSSMKLIQDHDWEKKYSSKSKLLNLQGW